ncbi:MAG TPA: nicotinate (nicotinamide) nucleotide adenylyltransferase [Candidatus Limnocylindrales bacterium]|nr:nicotinate (nicotinamide) nucleotide adenylyltransferase [Candidatus Limnocylindrales bacterium]
MSRAAPAVRAGSIGILGGTFDPFHVGHLALARAARDALGLERLLVMPAAQPPHKPDRPVTPAEIRFEMVDAGIAGEARLEASRIELDRTGPSWTVDTVAALTRAELAAGRAPDLTVVLSAESFAGFRSWREPDRILELARIAVAPRAGTASPDAAAIAANAAGAVDRIVAIPGPQVDVSASAIRRRVAAGESIEGLVPPGVAEVIARHRLYRDRDAQEDPSIVTDPAPLSAPPAGDGSPLTGAPRPDGLPTRGPAAAAAAAATVVPAADRAPLDIARRIVELAEDKKAADIVLLDLTGLTTLADAFVICSGGSERQLDAIADGIVEGLRPEKVRPIGREGTAASHWVLIDFGAVVVHVFTPPEREYYSLEKHWSEAKVVLRVQ